MSASGSASLRPDLAAIAAMIRPGTRILDVGCGDGALLEHLVRTKHVDGRGIELSQQNVNACVARGLSVMQGDADADLGEYPSGAFDAVILSHTIQATERPRAVLEHLLRRAIAETYRRTLGPADLSGLLDKFDSGDTVESGELVSSTELLRRIGQVPGLAKIMERLGMSGDSPEQAAAALEFALEGLFLTRRLSKDVQGGRADGTATYRT